MESRPTADLDAALRKWNAIATASFPELQDSLDEARRELGMLLRAIEERRVLAQSVTTQPGAAAALAKLPEHLAAYHIELRALAIQTNRALEAGAAAASLLAKVSGNAVRLTDVRVPEPDGEMQDEVQDDGLVDELRERIAELEAQAEDYEERIAELEASPQLEIEPFPPAAPMEMQDELVRLRQEVEALSKVEEEDMTEGGYEDRIQGEAFDDAGKRRPMGLILLKAGVISTEQLELALSHQRSAWNRHLGAILVELGFAEAEAVAQAIAAQTRVEFVRLREEVPQMDAVRLASRKLAEHHTVIPIRTHINELIVAMANPLDLVALEDLKLATGRPIQPVVATAQDIDAAIRRYYALV